MKMPENQILTTNDNAIDYQAELKKMEATSNTLYWKPSQGQHKLTLLSEPKETSYTDKEGNKKDQWQFDVHVLTGPDADDKIKSRPWSIPKSQSLLSLRGQLVKIASKTGKLAGTTLTLIVQGERMQRRYTVIENNTL